MSVATFETNIPARLDRLPWTRFHWLVVIALGITWILDGLEVTLVGSLSGAIARSPGMNLSAGRIGLAASWYLVGAVAGALLFGWLTDRLGRKRLFTVTLLIYVLAAIAVNATIQELIPARRRGFTDLVINGSFWVGSALGALGSLVALDPAILPQTVGWRVAFMLGGGIGFAILLLRRFIPESPRWLMTHGQPEAAEQTMREIEARVGAESGAALPAPPPGMLRLRSDTKSWFAAGVAALFGLYRRRMVLGVGLMAAQAFCYNAVLFTYATLLERFYHVPGGSVGLYMLPFALGNFLGPLLLGRLFDTVGRRPMIVASYATAGLLMLASGWLFRLGWLGAAGQSWAWTVVFFFASAAASSAYLTVGENFPLEVRAVAIALFYAFGTALGGVAGPAIFGALIETGSRADLFWGYGLGGGLMIGAAALAAWLGVDAAGKSLEMVAPPLSQVGGP
jgi:MFS family permease